MRRAWLLLLLGWLKIACCEDPTLCETRNIKAGELFSTDNFPSKYSSNLKCKFNLEAAPGKKVHLTFFVIDLEQNEGCQYDAIFVRDTNGSELHTLCGENQANIEVTSTGNLLTLELKSDSVQEGSGFLASWEEVDIEPIEQEARDGEYMVSYPSSLLISTPERICVELFKEQVEAELSVEVFDSSKGEQPHLFDRSSVVSNETSVAAGSGNGCLEIVLPESIKGDAAILKIILDIQGSKTVTKYESVKLLKKENYLLVQTDKGQYKAKDTVKFRVLALDHDLRPSEIKSMEEVWIEDPRGRRVKQWSDVQLRKGLLQEEMKLSEEPELGTWTINYSWRTSSGSNKEKETFQVSEYVLPKFSVELKSPAAVLKNDETVEWMVCAKYTHGGAVKGVVKSNFSSQFSQGWRRPPVLKSITADTNVTADEDCATIQLNRAQILDLTEKVAFFKLAVEFVEEGTGTVVKEETSASLKDKEILIEAGSSSRNHILGGFPYNGELVVKNHDESPVIDEEIEVCMRLYKDVREIRNKLNRRGIYGLDEEEIVELGRQMIDIHFATRCHVVTSDQSGKVKFHVPLSTSLPKDVTKLSIKAKAVNRKADNATGMAQPETKHDVSLSHEGGDLSLGLLRKENKALPCDKDFAATVFFSSTGKKSITLHYNAVSKGEIVRSDRMEVNVGAVDAMAALVEGTTELAVEEEGRGDSTSMVSSAEITLPIDHTVSPSLKLVVYVNEGNTTLTDSHTYKIEACQQHKVSASWNQEKVYPRSEVTLSVTAQPDSLCALSATDKSVDLLGNKNKITGERMAELREQIGRRKTSQVSFNWKMQNKCPETFKALKVFEGTGIKIVSDLPFLSQCETVIDANKNDGSDGHPEVMHDSVPVAFAAPSDSRRKRSARFKRCLEAVVAEKESSQSFGVAAPQTEAFVASNRVSQMDAPLPKVKVSKPQQALRSFFPENWLFSLELMDGDWERNLTAPDTITTWNAEAVCVSSEVGLGVAKPAALLVSQDFFAELRLPYSVKRGERFPLNVTVFNYIDAELPIEVTILNTAGDLELSERVHQLCIGANDNEVISVDTEALKLGDVNVTVEATIKNNDDCRTVSEGEGFKDALVKPLRVKAEGVPVEKVESDFKCFESGQEAFSLSTLETPEDIVEDSERAWLYLTGDIMGPALENVGNLVRMPTGCGEQNMVGLVPNIYLLQYLEGTGQKNEELEEKAKEYMRIGYRRQAKYNHPNGAYSIWGDKGDKDGSSWLTAFVVKSFSEAAQYIDVDSKTLQRSVDWLMGGQMENGCFPKRGYVHSSYLKGGGRDSSLTPFIVTALLQAASSPKLDIRVDFKRLAEGVNCMMKSLNESDMYASILTAHSASLLANKLGSKVKADPKTDEEAVNLLDKLATSANTSLPDAKFWEIVRPETPCSWYWGCRASSESVEMTAYMIQSLVLRGRAGAAVDSVKWLGKQRNSRGGFVSTQDTVVALQALSMYSQNITSIPLDMAVTVSHSNPTEEEATELGVFGMDETNKLLLRRQKVPDLPSKLTIETKGSGCAMVQTVLRYNTPEAPQNSGFTLRAAQEGSDLNVCAQYTGSQSETGMVVMEVEMVSGWEAKFSEIESLVNDVNYEIQRVERGAEDKDNVVLYFDSWPREEQCIALPLKQATIINEVKPAVVSLYDYYNTDDKASVLYSLK